MATSFRTIALVGRPADPPVAEALLALAPHLSARGLRVLVDEATPLPFGPEIGRVLEARLPIEADLVIAVGGDGTLLYAARLADGHGVPLLGINRGRLGFLADIRASEMLERVDDVLAGHYTEDIRRTLTARLIVPGEEERIARALNDVVLQKRETGRMLDFESLVDGRFVNTHGGDGLVIATATGSTAYALSCGGPILSPNLDAVVIAPISPHTLSDRPIVVAGSATVEVRLITQAPMRAEITCDGALLGDLPPEGRLIVGPCPRPITLLHPPGYDYYRILRSKLYWGRGARHGQTEPEC